MNVHVHDRYPPLTAEMLLRKIANSCRVGIKVTLLGYAMLAAMSVAYYAFGFATTRVFLAGFIAFSIFDGLFWLGHFRTARRIRDGVYGGTEDECREMIALIEKGSASE